MTSGAEGRHDLILVRVTNTGAKARELNPCLIINTAFIPIELKEQFIVIDEQVRTRGAPARPRPGERKDRVACSLKLVGASEGGKYPLEALTVPAGEPSEIEQLTLPQDLYGAVWYRKQPQDPIQADYPDAAVLYRKDRFTKLDEGFFWLGPTPDQGYGAGFANKATFPRLVAWALLHDTAGARDLYVASTHFDNNSPNQELSAPLVLERLGPLAAQHPVVFVGDFNSKPDSLAYAILATGKGAQPGQPGQGFHFQNAFDLATKWAAVTNGDQPATYDPQQRIDHFWLAGAPFQVAAWTVDLWTYGTPAQAPSDHDAMVTDLVWPLP